MNSYIVQSGDTLSGIAEKTLGSAGKWRLLAEINALPDPNRLKVGQVLKIPSDPTEAPNTVNIDSVSHPPVTEDVRFHVEGNKVFALKEGNSKWFLLGTLKKKGLSRTGVHDPKSFIRKAGNLLSGLNLTQSEINVMLATAENEGNLDAINTYDDQYLSFGIFQWTAGGDDGVGELACLLNRVKKSFPDDFEHYWGRFGLNITNCGSACGCLTLNGHVLKGSQQMSILRDHIWAYRFAQAGADDQVKAAQITHATGRLVQFYFPKSKALGDFALADLITSEYGVALLLDNHVNRPGYVHPCVARAMENCGIEAWDLAQGSDSDEQMVLQEYLNVRVTYGKTPMTDAKKRGDVTRRYVQNDVISDRRGSFQSSRG